MTGHPNDPSTRLASYSAYAEDNAAHAEELRGEVRALLQKLRPLLAEMVEMGAHGPAVRLRADVVSQCPDELADHVAEWLGSDWDRAQELDLEHFESHTG